jgi:hypothetical protein
VLGDSILKEKIMFKSIKQVLSTILVSIKRFFVQKTSRLVEREVPQAEEAGKVYVETMETTTKVKWPNVALFTVTSVLNTAAYFQFAHLHGWVAANLLLLVLPAVMWVAAILIFAYILRNE